MAVTEDIARRQMEKMSDRADLTQKQNDNELLRRELMRQRHEENQIGAKSQQRNELDRLVAQRIAHNEDPDTRHGYVIGPPPVAENPKKACGDLKPGIHYLPMGTLDQVCVVMRGGPDQGGAGQYGLRNWRKQPIRASTYYDAMWRHLRDWYEKLEDADVRSGQSHLAHIIANAMLVMDSIEKGVLVDDRDAAEVLTKNVAD